MLFQQATLLVAPVVTADDYTAYIANARALLTGTAYGMPGYLINDHYSLGTDTGQGTYPPGYPALLALVARLAGTDVTLALCVQVNIAVFGAFVLLFMHRLGRMTDRLSACMGGLLIGFSPALLDPGSLRLPSEPLFLLMMVAFMGADAALRGLLLVRPGGWRSAAGMARLVGTAAVMAAAVAVRINGILMVPALGLADLVRFRRITLSAVLCGVFVVLLFVGAITLLRIDYLTRNASIFSATNAPVEAVARPQPGLGERLSTHAAAVAINLRQYPSNLSAAWDWVPVLSGAPQRGGLVGKLANAVLLAFAVTGFVLCARRGFSGTEAYVLFETAMLLNLTDLLRSPRYALPISVICVMYIFVAAQALGRVGRAGRIARFLPPLLLAGLVACNGLAVLQLRSPRFAATAPEAVALQEWVKANTLADAVFVTRQPRSLVAYTGRAASDYHFAVVDADFRAWAAGLKADWLVLSIDQRDSRRLAARDGADEVARLTNGLDRYERALFGPAGPPAPAFANLRYRVYPLRP
jgi:hypothetical protein